MNLRKLQLDSEAKIFKISGMFFRTGAQTNPSYTKHYKLIEKQIFDFDEYVYDTYPIFKAIIYKIYKARNNDEHKQFIIIYLIDEKKYTTISENRYLDALKNV